MEMCGLPCNDIKVGSKHWNSVFNNHATQSSTACSKALANLCETSHELRSCPVLSVSIKLSWTSAPAGINYTDMASQGLLSLCDSCNLLVCHDTAAGLQAEGLVRCRHQQLYDTQGHAVQR